MIWRVTIEVWPHSTSNGQVNDQAAAGDRVREFKIESPGIAVAYQAACHIAEGIRSHPMVWTAPIIAIVRIRE